MTVYGLSGKSGSGKSYNAAELCGRMHIEGLIDDGIFVYDGVLAAGISAKTKNTRIGAVKAAIFQDEEERKAMSDAIRKKNPDKLLILGTSDEMIELIACRLSLPKPQQIIYIEEITTREQRERAKLSRNEKGMHIVPVPTFQVKKQFSGYFIDAKKSFARSDTVSGGQSIEKTLVRPSYSFLGDYEISSRLISDIVVREAAATPGISSVIWAVSENTDNGMYIRCIITVERNAQVRSAASHLQEAVHNMVEKMTAFNVPGVDVEIRSFK